MHHQLKLLLSVVAFLVTAPPVWILLGPQADQIVAGVIVGLLAAFAVWSSLTAISIIRSPADDLCKKLVKQGFFFFATALIVGLIGWGISGRFYHVKASSAIMQRTSPHQYLHISRLPVGSTYRRSDLVMSEEWFGDDGHAGGFRPIPIQYGYVTRYVDEQDTQVILFPLLHPFFGDLLYLIALILIAIGAIHWAKALAAVHAASQRGDSKVVFE